MEETSDIREDTSRRVFLKRAATIGWATPLIVSALASPAFASHVPVGGTCTTTTTHCVTADDSLRPVICCTSGTNSGKCGYPSGTVLGTGGGLPCSSCCSGSCGSGNLNKTCA